jgi:hypothetical protein
MFNARKNNVKLIRYISIQSDKRHMPICLPDEPLIKLQLLRMGFALSVDAIQTIYKLYLQKIQHNSKHKCQLTAITQYLLSN